MKNPKVGKAEILEGVIHFLKAEKRHQGAVARETNPSPDGQQSYRDGMRSCLLRVRSFISSQNQEVMESSSDGGDGGDGGAAPGAQEPQEPQEPRLYPGQRHLAPVLTPAADPSPGVFQLHHHQHQPFLTQLTGMSCDSQELFSSVAAPQHVSSAVWRPWPK